MEKKNTFLKVLSILCLLGGILGLIGGITTLLKAFGTGDMMAIIFYILTLLQCLVAVFVGLTCFNVARHTGNKGTASKLIILEILLSIVLVVMQMVIMNLPLGSTLVGMALGLLFPIITFVLVQKA